MENNKSQLHKKGFTLIEMLIAVMIFSLSLVALMGIASKGLKTAQRAERQVIADYLAIEAIEVVHNLRDAVLLRSGFDTSSWELVFQGSPGIIDGDEGCFNGSRACNFYFEGNKPPILDVCNDCTVFLNENDFFYYQTHSDAIGPNETKKSPYRREIYIKSGGIEGQVIVTVTVFWDNESVTYTENLYLWQ